ncbi:MAG: ATP-binding cassette domain-containing protein [Spirochaetales bacterium]|nr:ATP-binding cassette domain-containing protein [Spirochaetales bacterium]
MLKILNVLSVLEFGTSFTVGFVSLSNLAAEILFVIGLVGLFRKSGKNPLWALVPCYRLFVLAECADREAEGRVLFFTDMAYELLTLFYFFFGTAYADATTRILLAILNVSVYVVLRIYSLRVFQGMDELYGRKRSHIWIWLFFRGITSICMGYLKKWQPSVKVQDMEEQTISALTGQRDVKASDTGLSINLEDKTIKIGSILHKKKRCLLRDIHMNIKPGHMVLLLGGSGSGKTVLLNAVCGYEKANAKILLNGTDIYAHYDQVKYDIGFVPQQNLMRLKDTVENTLNDASKLRIPMSVKKADLKARENEVLDIFGLTPSRKNMVEKLSGGKQRRLSIALELVSNPSLFILDEPDSGLDGVMARELMTQLRKIADQGRIVMVITHTPDRVIDLFDDVIVLARDKSRTGRLAFFGPIDEARAFFDRTEMEGIVMAINPKDSGGEGRADEFIERFAESINAEVENG